MIAGLPATAWLMLLAAGGIGLAVELVFFFRHRQRAAPPGEDAERTGNRR
ncbi:MAG TPA: hypothetical protein VMV46_06680 [Thermoanaerobaculia bacterium]|nr:hypothetical protein [Thermoanaerobaculia bacterium]